jgi:hypothetical protein
MEKKIVEKKEHKPGLCLKIGFWTMLVSFLVMVVCTYLGWQIPSLIIGILFIISVFFVLIMSIKTLVPADKSLAYIALSIAIIFILYLLLSSSIGVSSALG